MATLIDTVIAAGRYHVAWTPDTSIPGGIYRCRMVASDSLSGEVLYDETIYPVKHDFDPARTVIGYTNSRGSYETHNTLLFPYVLEGVPELTYIDVNGDTLGTFEYKNIVTVIVTDTAAGQSQPKQATLSKTNNVVSIVWAPPMSARVTNETTPAPGRPRLVADIDPPIDLIWQLGPNFPNPFN